MPPSPKPSRHSRSPIQGLRRRGKNTNRKGSKPTTRVAGTDLPVSSDSKLVFISSSEGFALALEDTSKLYGYAMINSFLVTLLVVAVSMMPFVRCWIFVLVHVVPLRLLSPDSQKRRPTDTLEYRRRGANIQYLGLHSMCVPRVLLPGCYDELPPPLFLSLSLSLPSPSPSPSASLRLPPTL